MPVVKANEALPKRQPVIVIYGEPGVCKTSIGNTCEEPLLIDFDRGVDRSLFRKDTLQVKTWDEVLAEETAGTFKSYKTIVIDTAKAALDDFLMQYVVNQDFKLKTNKLGMFGAIGDQFKLFVNSRRSEEAAIVIIAHAKKDEDTKKNIPDVTGQSYQLLLRIADQVGYVCIKNGKRVISFEPSDNTVGKNVAGLPEITVPDKADVAFKTFGAKLVNDVREAIAAMSEEQREALEKSAMYQDQIEKADTSELSMLVTAAGELPDYLKLPLTQLIGDRYVKDLKACKDVDAFNTIFADINQLPDGMKNPLRVIVSQEAKEKGYTPNAATKQFEVAKPAEAETPTADPAKAAKGTRSKKEEAHA
jgi:F0F1-type ATP synthase delta subunit